MVVGLTDDSFSSLTVEPVSYTHLDVYKRQEYDRLYEAALSRSKADWIVGINGTRPVSYTHLAQMKLRYEKQLRKEETVNGICSGPEGS